MNIDHYLSVLEVKNRAPSLDFLNDLIKAHLKSISFNNLAVYFRPGQILNLELDPLFEKVILNREGGYCFENNKVFFYLLKNLGFDVSPFAARVLYGQSGDIPRTHRMTVVVLDGKRYVADVGFGRFTPPVAVPFESEEPGLFSIEKKSDSYLLQVQKDDEKFSLYNFDEGHYQESDFFVANYYTNTHPNSKFVKNLILSRQEEGVVELINGKIYSRITGKEREDMEIKGSEEFSSILKKFGIQKNFDFNKLYL